MQSSRNSYLFLGVVVLLAAISSLLYVKTPYRLGLDIKGGVRFTYEADFSKLKASDIPDARQRTLLILENRANQLGVAEAVVQPKNENQFVVELPGYQNIDQAKQIMGTSARIEFYDARNVITEHATYREYDDVPSSNPDVPSVDFRRKADGKLITPSDPEYANIIKGWEYICGGDDLKAASMQARGDSYIPEMTFQGKGAEKLKDWSLANNTRREKIAAVLDGRCISIAGIENGAILDGAAIITGNFSTAYVRNLRDLLNSGALPVDLHTLDEAKVDPVIGQHALDQILTAGLVAAAIISVFMLVYYVFPGVIAVIALALYILFTLTVLKLIGATFSLAAIAGFVLSVGMAVDANILVFERLKEELRSGRSLHDAIRLGFSRALPAIVDSNACTILTALVLANLGTGPVKGFALTLIVGVAISLFTAVMVTRSLLVFFVGSGIGDHPNWYGLSRQWFGESLEKDAHKKPLQIVNKAGRYFFISALTIVPGVIFWAMGGLKPNVEFTGGIEAVYNVTAGGNYTSGQIVSNLEKAKFVSPQATLASSTDKANQPTKLAYITIQNGPGLTENNAQNQQTIATAAGLTGAVPTSISRVGGTIRTETVRNAVLGIILSSALIIFYLGLRFGFALGGFMIGLRFSVSAILALGHDILVVLGLATVTGFFFGWQVSALFISAMLTVIGFSTHDTIVIFDRIRENLRRPHPGEDSADLINRSITQSVARSINTSMTVVITLAVLIAIGSATPELKLFNAAMLVGIISGTYSSIFNASPILYLWDKALAKKHPSKTLLGIADANRPKVRATAAPVQVPGPSAQPAAPAAAGYSQVRRRRASEVEKSRRNIDDDDL